MKNNDPEKTKLIFNKQNYLLMIVGVIFIFVGFMLMIGGKNEDPNVFDANELYSFRRITLAPIIVMIGFVIEVFAIFFKAKDKNPS